MSYPIEILEKAFNFTDIYLVKNKLSDSYMYTKESEVAKRITKNNALIIKDLFMAVIMEIKKNPSRNDHLVIFEGFYFRCYQINTVKGPVIACRKMPYEFQSLKDCKVDSRIVKELLHPRLNKGGLVFICGSPGQGKTTTVSAFVRDRLKKHGGLCITIEDPPEMSLDGIHNIGRCIQTQVDSQNGFAAAVRSSMRAYPTGQNTSMFIGEIRDKETASEALKSAIDGRLIVVTLHSDSIFTGLQRLASLAEGALGTDEAYLLLAESFRIGIHQKLIINKRNLKADAKLSLDFLSDSNAVYNKIKTKQIHMLKSEFERQQKTIKNNELLDYRYI